MPANPIHALEPALREMLADPIVRALMASDGVVAGELEELIHFASCRLGDRKRPATANRGGPGAGRTLTKD